MYPDLSYLFHDLFGTAVDNWTSIFKSFGLMLGIAFLACGMLVRSEFKRLELEGKISSFTQTIKQGGYTYTDLILNTLITSVLIAKVPYIINHFNEFKADPASILFSKLGNWPLGIGLGLAFGAYTYYTKFRKSDAVQEITVTVHPYQKTIDIIFIAAMSGILGARIFSIFENMKAFVQDPIGTLFSSSGLTVYGGIILATIAVILYIRKIGINPKYMMDIGGMGILLGYAIGRIGCQVAGDGDWGIVAGPQPAWWFMPDWLWAYNYPNNVNNDGMPGLGCDTNLYQQTTGYLEEKCMASCGRRYCHQLPEGVHPTPVYETIFSLIGFGLLWLVRKRVKVTGALFFMYMIYNGIERFFIEGIRVNDRYNYFGYDWSQAQYISIGFVVVGVAGLLYLYRNGKKAVA